jgi:hypothetical protein
MISIDVSQIQTISVNANEGRVIPILVHTDHIESLLTDYTGSPEESLSPEFCYNLAKLILDALQSSSS